MKQVAELQLAIQHKPFFQGSESHQVFLQNCIVKTERLLTTYPFLNLSSHLSHFNAQLVK